MSSDEFDNVWKGFVDYLTSCTGESGTLLVTSDFKRVFTRENALKRDATTGKIEFDGSSVYIGKGRFDKTDRIHAKNFSEWVNSGKAAAFNVYPMGGMAMGPVAPPPSAPMGGMVAPPPPQPPQISIDMATLRAEFATLLTAAREEQSKLEKEEILRLIRESETDRKQEIRMRRQAEDALKAENDRKLTEMKLQLNQAKEAVRTVTEKFKELEVVPKTVSSSPQVEGETVSLRRKKRTRDEYSDPSDDDIEPERRERQRSRGKKNHETLSFKTKNAVCQIPVIGHLYKSVSFLLTGSTLEEEKDDEK